MKGHYCDKKFEEKDYPTRFLLKTIGNKFHTIVDNLLSKYDLTSTQANFLFFLMYKNPNPIQKDFEDFFQISHSAATGVLARLKEKQMVTFVRSETDKRCKKILICEKGRNIIEQFKSYSKFEKKYLFKNFTKEEKDELDRLLKKLIVNIDDTIKMEKK